MTHFLVENFLWLQNHFLGNRFPSKIFMETFFVENWYRCKIISSKTGYCKKKKIIKKMFGGKLLNHFLENRFLPKIFIKNFWWKIFDISKIISSKPSLQEKFGPKTFWSKICYGFKIIFSKTACHQKFS